MTYERLCASVSVAAIPSAMGPCPCASHASSAEGVANCARLKCLAMLAAATALAGSDDARPRHAPTKATTRCSACRCVRREVVHVQADGGEKPGDRPRLEGHAFRV